MKEYVVNNFKAINYQYAVGQLSTYIDLEGCSLKTMMFEKYPSISPYTYCANNPMKYVDPRGKAYVPTNKEGDIAINNYLSNFSDRTLKKAFGLQRNVKDGFPIYYSSDTKTKSYEEFTKALGKAGKKMTDKQKGEAYAFYNGLQDNTIYQVEAWVPEIASVESQSYKNTRDPENNYRKDTRVVIQDGAVTSDRKDGYAKREVGYSNKTFTNDFDNLDASGKINFEGIFNSNRKSADGNIFGEGFNFYTNYDRTTVGKSAGLILIDGREDNYGNCLGKALQTLGY
ncbi:MAG: hypothetical protein RBS13_01490 [Bacteroidales bacterium]|jgi:hypothetical protein|nr:hypothetical protein [Bacteroidales bacterium]